MTAREIQGHLEEMYQVEVSPALISTVTDAVLEHFLFYCRPFMASLNHA
jgi:transposase-like protein